MIRRLLFAIAFSGVLVATSWAETPPLPATPVAVTRVLYARSFSMQTPFRYDWSAGDLQVREGMMLVIECDPALIRPRETEEPVLYVGSYPAQRVAPQHGSNRLVVLVPAVVDLAEEPIWFGTPGLPEAIDAGVVMRERTLAANAQIAPLSHEMVAAALRAGGPATRYATKAELSWALEDWVQRLATP
jgi:hypothetical protein